MNEVLDLKATADEGHGLEAHPLVSIIAPVYNEESVIAKFIARLKTALEPLSKRFRFEIILVDDGSRDRSLDIMKDLARNDPLLRVVELRRNSGQTAALQAGIDNAAGDILVTMDSDLQHFPEEIPHFLDKIEHGWDVVCGWRHERKEGIVRRWPSHMANKLLRWISGLSIHDIGTTYRAYRAEVLKDVRLLGENHRFVPIFAYKVGARVTEIPIQNIERPEGKSNYGLGRTLNVFYDMFFLYFFLHHVDRPIRIFGLLASFCFFVGGLVAAVLLGIWLVYGTPVVRDHSGWFTLSIALLLSGLQVLLAGLVMEMIARLYYPGGEKVQYFVRRVWTKDNIGGERPGT